jgi:hypothetical protein
MPYPYQGDRAGTGSRPLPGPLPARTLIGRMCLSCREQSATMHAPEYIHPIEIGNRAGYAD